MDKEFYITVWSADGKRAVKVKAPISPKRIVDDPRLKGWRNG